MEEECPESELRASWQQNEVHGVLIESLSWAAIIAYICGTTNNSSNNAGFCIGSQETAVVGMFGVPGCFCAQNGLLPLECLGWQVVALAAAGAGSVWGECPVLSAGTGQSSLVAEGGGRPEEALEAPKGLGRTSCAMEALLQTGLWWVSYSYP